MAKFDIYEEITNRIIAQLEKGEIPWRKPWSGLTSGAYNRISKKQYSLLNQMLLAHDGEYATFKQWSDLGGKVRKGEKSEIVVFWKMLETTETNAKGEQVKTTIPFLRYINVFHISQIEGVEPLKAAEPVHHEPIEQAEKIKLDYVEKTCISIKEIVTDDAFYSPMLDFIQIPCREQYREINEFYGTLFHEMIHSTGHETRLNRLTETGKHASFGTQDYSKEELVAEIGSSTLLNITGIESEKSFKNNVGYIQSWLKVLKNDKKFIVSASSKAEKAVKYIVGEKEVLN